ncbi:kynureninase-like, partial [Stegodyphus dumicola]|uniref:kynureninase-like n=1 Tax=Stegodyphus dumicola TaxID=202533 RepID=UPI0015B15024
MDIKRNGSLTHGMPHLSEDSFRSALQHDFVIRSKTWSIDIDSLDYAKRLDKDDPLRDFRKRFHYPKKKNFSEVDQKNLADDEEECIYFCGHSLGLQLKSVEDALHEVLKNWAERGVESHFGGFLPAAFCDLPLKENMAYLVGAKASEVALMNGLTVNIHIML